MRVAELWHGGELPAAGAPRDRFEGWLSSAGPGRLLDVVLDRAWRDTELETIPTTNRARKVVRMKVRMLYQLSRADVARVNAAAVAAIEAAGGRVELGATVARVEGGELRITMA